MAGWAPGSAAAALALGGKNTVVRQVHPGGAKGVKFSLDEVAKRVREGRNDPRLKAWAGKVLIAAGKPRGARKQMQALLDAFRKQTMYIPDPVQTESMVAPHVTLCLDEHGLCMPAGDCFPQGTKLLRDDYELVSIEDIKPGDRIWGRDAWCTVEEKTFKGNMSLNVLRLNNGSSVALTEGHHVFVACCARHVNRVDSKACSCPVEDREIFRIAVRDVRPEYVLIQPKRISFGSNDLDPDRAYVEGLHVADGWIEVSDDREFNISGQDGCPKEAQKREVAQICERLGLETRWHHKSIAIKSPEWTVRIHQMGHRAPNKHILSLNLGEAQAAATLRGVMADSGANTSGRGRTFSTTSHALMMQIRVLHRMFGLFTSVRYMTAEEHQGLGQNPIWRVGVTPAPIGEERKNKLLRVKEVDHNVFTHPCWDIRTSDHYVYLPEHDVTVSNCDDRVIALAATALSIGIDVKIIGQAFEGESVPSHVIFSFYDPDEGRWLKVDPSHETWSVGNSAHATKNVEIDPMGDAIVGLGSSSADAPGDFIGVGRLPRGIGQAATPTTYTLGKDTIPLSAPAGSIVQEQPGSPYNTTCTKQTNGTWVCTNGSVFLAGQLENRASVTCKPGYTFLPPGICVPPEGTLFSDGSRLMPDGSTHFANGDVLAADGTFTMADGTVVAPNGTVTLSASQEIANYLAAAKQAALNPLQTAATGAGVIGSGLGTVVSSGATGFGRGLLNPNNPEGAGTFLGISSVILGIGAVVLLAPVVNEVIATRRDARAFRSETRALTSAKRTQKPG